MTAQQIWRLYCDAPTCTTSVVVHNLTDIPDAWTRISSADHLASWKPQTFQLRNGRTRQDRRTYDDVSAGSFKLHLCPEHPQVFAEHLPQSTGTTRDRGERNVTVRCSCGQFGTTTRDYIIVGTREEGPRRLPEQMWWRHLPAELQGYATRELVVPP